MLNRRQLLGYLSYIPLIGFFVSKTQSKLSSDSIPISLNENYFIPDSVLEPSNWNIIGSKTVHPNHVHFKPCTDKISLTFSSTEFIGNIYKINFCIDNNELFYNDLTNPLTLLNGDTINIEIDSPKKWIL